MAKISKRKLHNQAIKQEVNNSTEQKNKSGILKIVGSVSIGILLGWGLNAFISYQNKPKHAFIEDYFKYKFVNPYILTTVYDSLHHQELRNFKANILNYINKAKEDDSIDEIAVYFRDLTNGFWLGINEREKFIPASLAKVPIMIGIFQKAQNEPGYLDKQLIFKGSLTHNYLKTHPEIDDIRTTMTENEAYSVDKLVNLMITKSDNEAATMLFEDLGPQYWNALQERLKVLPADAPGYGSVLTVKGYSSYFRILYNATLLNREYSEKALEILSRAEYNKGISLAVPKDVLVCHKYGERDTLVGPTTLQIRQLHHAGIVYYPGKTFFMCIMTRGTDKPKLEKILFDISKLIYEEVDKQVKSFKENKPDNDIN